MSPRRTARDEARGTPCCHSSRQTAQDMAAWRPHITIQNKVEPREARHLQAQLRARFQARTLAIKGLGSWSYADDGRWLPLKSNAFRR